MKKKFRGVLSLALALVILVLPSLKAEAAEAWEKTYMDFLSQGENRIENVRRGNFLNHKFGDYSFFERNENLSNNSSESYLVEGIEFVDLLGKSHPQMLVYHIGDYSYDGIFVVYDLIGGRVEEVFRFNTEETRNGPSRGKTIFQHFRSRDYNSLVFGGQSREGDPRLYELSYDDVSRKLNLDDVSADHKGFSKGKAGDFVPEGYVDLSKSEKSPYANKRQKFINLNYRGKPQGLIYHVEDSTIRSKMSNYKKNHKNRGLNRHVDRHSYEPSIGVILNNEYLTTRIKPVNEGGRILVPFREIFEALGVDDIDWNQKEKLISASRGDRQIRLKIGDSQAWVNGEAVDLSVPAKLVRGNTLVPIRFVAEALGEKVDWNPEFKTVLINSSPDKIVRPYLVDTVLSNREIDKGLKYIGLESTEKRMASLKFEKESFGYRVKTDFGYIEFYDSYGIRKKAGKLGTDTGFGHRTIIDRRLDLGPEFLRGLKLGDSSEDILKVLPADLQVNIDGRDYIYASTLTSVFIFKENAEGMSKSDLVLSYGMELVENGQKKIRLANGSLKPGARQNYIVDFDLDDQGKIERIVIDYSYPIY